MIDLVKLMDNLKKRDQRVRIATMRDIAKGMRAVAHRASENDPLTPHGPGYRAIIGAAAVIEAQADKMEAQANA